MHNNNRSCKKSAKILEGQILHILLSIFLSKSCTTTPAMSMLREGPRSYGISKSPFSICHLNIKVKKKYWKWCVWPNLAFLLAIRVVVQSNFWLLRNQSLTTAYCNKHKEMSLEWKLCSTHPYLPRLKLTSPSPNPTNFSLIKGRWRERQKSNSSHVAQNATEWFARFGGRNSNTLTADNKTELQLTGEKCVAD